MARGRAREMAQMTADFFNQAGRDDDLSQRMAFARTVVAIHFMEDDVDEVCTVWLDRVPMVAELGHNRDAEVELFGPPQAFMEMISGKDAMAMLIARGEVTYEGPVRKFLRVVPILRTFDFNVYRGNISESAKPDEEEQLPARTGAE